MEGTWSAVIIKAGEPRGGHLTVKEIMAKKWHNLRLLLVDEIEVGCVDLIGQVEAKLNRAVFTCDKTTPGLQTLQHSQRDK